MNRGDRPISTQLAQEAIAAAVPALGSQLRVLDQCIGQVLRQEIFAERANPPFDRVCMDGIAIDSRSVGRGNRTFQLQATQGAGEPALRLAGPEAAVEVMTGAGVPTGDPC